jgi:hypothetical protein
VEDAKDADRQMQQCLRALLLRAGCRYDKADAGRGRHRWRSGVSGRAGRAPTSGVASNRAGRQYPRRVRPRRRKSRLRPMRGRKRDHSARVVLSGHGFVQNLRRGHYELGVEEPPRRPVAVAFAELALTI